MAQPLSQRIARMPIAYDAARGAETAAWFGDLGPRAQDLIQGVAGNAPFLDRLLRRDPNFTRQCFERAPEDVLDAIIEDLAKGADAITLRQAKARAALVIALADLAGAMDVTEVTAALSAFADAAIQAALHQALERARAQGRLEHGRGLFVLGLGKLGARELNYSSDVDLVVFYDATLFTATGIRSAQEEAVDLVRHMSRLLHDVTEDGYVFRLDLRLRPDPGAMPIALSCEAAEIYYAGRGQTWERAAFIKARVVAGDHVAGDAFLDRLRPFVFRRHLDFAAIADIHAIKRRLSHQGDIEAANLPGHDLKIGRGGIREIEFFVQGQQLIAGGRNPKLQARRTLQALRALVEAGLVADKTARDLAQAYRDLRVLEHRLQMIEDEQTQKLPRSAEGLDRLARFCGETRTDVFLARLADLLANVARHYDHLFADAPPSDLGLAFDGPEIPLATLERLSAWGFGDPADAARVIKGWVLGRPRCLAQPPARQAFERILPDFLRAIGACDDPPGALARLDTVLQRLGHGLNLFHLLAKEPAWITLIATVLGNAPRLARLLAEEARSFDAILTPGFLQELPGPRAQGRAMRALGSGARGIEDLLDGVRRHAREARLRAGLHLITGRAGAVDVGPYLTAMAEAVVERLLDQVEMDFVVRHGHIPGARYALVALGRLGGGELTVSSDLDLIAVYDLSQEVEASDGIEPLAPSTYFIRLTQRLIAALSAPTAEGKLFELDLRLRPDGDKGPLAPSWTAWQAYMAGAAWTYEKMALTRARVIAVRGFEADRFRDQIHTWLNAVLTNAGEPEAIRADIRAMRQRLGSHRKPRHRLSLKDIPGGLIDIDFAAQTLALTHGLPRALGTLALLDQALAAGVLSAATYATLTAALVLQMDLQQVLRACLDDDVAPEALPPGLAKALARMGQVADFDALMTKLGALQDQTASLCAAIMAGDAA